MTPVAKFACQHRRTDKNTTRAGTCLKCSQARIEKAAKHNIVAPRKWPRCGHPLTVANSTNEIRKRCKMCKQETDRERGKARRRSKWLKCSHPRTPENTAKTGRRYETCKTCKRWRDAAYGKRGASKASGSLGHFLAPPRMDLSHLLRPLPAKFEDSGRSYDAFPKRLLSA